MTILVVTPIFPPEIGGPATYASELLHRLSEDNIHVVSFGQNPSTNPSVTLVPLSGGPFTRQLRLFKEILKRGKEVDVFFLLDPLTTGLMATLAGKLLGKKIVLKFVGDPGWEQSMLGQEKIIPLESYLNNHSLSISYLLTKFVLLLTTKIITPSHYLSQVLHTHYAVPNAKLTVIPNSIAIATKRPDKKKQLIFVGRLVSWKNVDQIIQAFELISNKFPDYKLIIVGEGPEEEKLKTHIAPNIVFTGRLSHAQSLNLIATSKILLLYSTYEGLPHVALEALSFGTVPVLSEIGGNTEVAGAVIVESHAPSKLAQKLDELLTSKSKLTSLAKHATIEAENHYAWQKNLPKLKDLLVSVSNSSSGRS